MSIDATAQRAAHIVAKVSPKLTADAALRDAFTHQGRLSPAEKTAIAQAVFSTYRWQRWLDPKAATTARVAHAMALQARFDHDPTAVKPQALAALALPDWVHAEVELSPADLRALQSPPALWLRTRPAFTERISNYLKKVTPAPAPAHQTGLRFTGHRDLYRTEPFQQGHFEIQDLGSQLVGHACAPQPGETWWDACAGEGGKTLHLADLLDGKGMIWATDRNVRRLATLKQRAARAEMFNYRSEVWEGGEQLPGKTKFDGILIDAPCSGIGTWRRHPHARWTTTMDDVNELAVVQRQLLENVLPALKPGGRLIYAVCTLARTETTAIADAFTAAHPELEPLSVLERGPQVFIHPAEWNANGMFIAGWTKPKR